MIKQVSILLCLLLFCSTANASIIKTYDNNDVDWVGIKPGEAGSKEVAFRFSKPRVYGMPYKTSVDIEKVKNLIDAIEEAITEAKRKRKLQGSVLEGKVKPGARRFTKFEEYSETFGTTIKGEKPSQWIDAKWEVNYKDPWLYNIVIIFSYLRSGYRRMDEVNFKFSPERIQNFLDGLKGAVNSFE